MYEFRAQKIPKKILFYDFSGFEWLKMVLDITATSRICVNGLVIAAGNNRAVKVYIGSD